MLYGEQFERGGFPGKRLVIGGHTVEVMYIIIDGVLKITNAWVAK